LPSLNLHVNSLKDVYDRNELFSGKMCLQINVENIEEIVAITRLARYRRIIIESLRKEREIY
jgi:hypothetical protein